MKLSYTLITALLCFLHFSAISQNTNQTDSPPARCHSDEYHALMMQDPDFASKFSAMQTEALAAINADEKINCSSGVITIPIAVHYAGNVNSSNYACLLAAAEAQVQVMNEDFGAYNADIANFCDIATSCPSAIDAAALSTGSCIQFCLATQNHPTCSGLNNGDAAITVGQYTFNGGAACWSGYLNFFVTDGINFLGQAPLFGGNNPNGNGVQVVANAFGGPGISCTSGTGINTSNTYDLGRTATHEVGHYLGLEHVFNGCNGGDGIADTPAQSTENYGCPTFNLNTCTSTAANSCSTNDFFFNFMDYVDDPCMYMFTDDQATLMYNTVTSHNNWATNTCAAADEPVYDPIYTGPCVSQAPVADFQVTSALTVCENNPTITFQDLSQFFPNSYDWTFSGAGVSPVTSNVQNPSVTVTSSGTLSVTLEASNGGGNSSTSQNFNVTVLPTGHPDCPQCVNAVVDNGFENGAWTEFSSNGYALVTNDNPQNGTMSAYLGGAPNEVSIIYQTVTIPANSTSAILTYSYAISTEEGCGGQSNDAGGIAIDDNGDGQFSTLTSIDICNTTDTGGAWITASYDLSAYIGTTFEIGFYAQTNGNQQNSDFYIDDVNFEVCSAIALAVELIEFEATAFEKQIDVNWTTVNEVNNKGFKLYRSIDPTNGFKLVETIEAKENGGDYLFTDQNVRTGITYYYQLEQIDLEETKTNLGIVSASIRSAYELEVTPNPATDQLNVHFANDGKMNITIDVMDIVGRTILTKNVEVDGAQIINLDVNDLEGGVYILNVSSDGILLENLRFLKN